MTFHAKDNVIVNGDDARLHELFLNLVDNAVKYSGGKPKISVRLKSSSLNKAEIYIRDNGIGIARADLKRIFKRFYRVPNKAIDAAKGTGLGLPIVRSIIEKHGGRVSAESNGEGKGTTWDGGHLEPTLARWPGKIPAGTTCRELTATIDILPTFAKLAGSQPPPDRIIDGRDIWPLLSGQPGAKTPHDWRLWEA